jgi:uncharacterized protein (TIGR03435 family)
MRVVILCAVAGPALGQSFEVASVKPAPPPDSRTRSSMRGGPGTRDPGQITYNNVTLSAMIQRAYDVRQFQVAGPDWLGSLRYLIAAKVPVGATNEQFQAMLRNLLAERFHLELHHLTRQLEGFELVVARGGPKLKASAESAGQTVRPDARPPTDAHGFPVLDHPGLAMMEDIRGKAVIVFLTARAQTVSTLVERLVNEFHVPILDRTGVVGNFDFHLQFAPQPPGALPVEAPEESGPDLATAVQQQLGLRLNAGKVPTDILIIDRADQVPTGN